MKNFLSIFSILFFLVFSLYLTVQNYENRLYGWDMPGYLGAIYKTDNPYSNEKVHSMVYKSIQKESSKTAFEKTIGKNPFGAATTEFARSAKSFDEQIPYYQVKHSYNAFGYAFYSLGFSAPKSLLIVNGIFYFLTGIFLFLIFLKIFSNNTFFASILSLLILFLPPIRQMASDATPDMVCLSILLLFLFSVLKKYSKLFQFAILLNLILVRPDMIIFALTYFFLLIIYNYFITKKHVFESLIYMFVLGSVYVGIVKFYDYPSWRDVFYDSFIYRRLYISKESPNFTISEYLDVVFANLKNFKKISLLAILFLGSIMYFSKITWEKWFGIFIFVNIYLKFLFFPMAGEYRFFIGYILILVIWLIFILKRKFSENTTPLRM